MSDKPIQHETQEGMAAAYGAVLRSNSVNVVGSLTRRKVLTTRNDGNIRFEVGDASHFNVRVHAW